MRRAGLPSFLLPALLLPALLPFAASPATAQADRSGLTPASFRRDCLFCHARAAPEGVSPEILAGLRPVPGLKPADAMPNFRCWRRIQHPVETTPPG